MTKEEKEKTLNFEEGSESVSDTSVTDTSTDGEGEGTEDSQDNTVDENVVDETTQDEDTTTEAESEEVVETKPTPETEPEEVEESLEEEEKEPVEPPKKEGEDTEESNSSESKDKDKDKETPKETQDDNSIVKDLRNKKKELEQELVTTKVAFEEAVSELEELREYKFKRESEDVQKEFSETLSADVVTSMLEKNKSEGIEAVREALFAELGKKVITKKEGLNFSNNEVATFSVTTKVQDADDDYGIYGKL